MIRVDMAPDQGQLFLGLGYCESMRAWYMQIGIAWTLHCIIVLLKLSLRSEQMPSRSINWDKVICAAQNNCGTSGFI